MQGVTRSARILRALAEVQSEDGWARLADVAEVTGIHRGTVHRFLRAWELEGWVEHNERGRRYRTGPALLALSRTATSQSRLLSAARQAVEALAEETGDTAMFFLYSGLDGICMERQTGSYPIQFLAIHIGDRVPLGNAAGTLAILSTLDDMTAMKIVDENRRSNNAMAQFTREYYLDLLQTARQQGYAEKDGAVPGVKGFGMALFDGPRQVIGGISLAVIKDRLQEGHREVVLKALSQQAKYFYDSLKGDPKNTLPQSLNGWNQITRHCGQSA